MPDAAPREYLVYLGYNDADYTLTEPKNGKETEALKLLMRYYWSTTRLPCTAVQIAFQECECDANGRHEGHVIAWYRNSTLPVEYGIHVSVEGRGVEERPHDVGTFDAQKPIVFFGDNVIKFLRPVVRVALSLIHI